MTYENLPGAAAELEDLAMTVIGRLNSTDLGLIRFGMATDWERHGADELILVLEGAVELVVEGEEPRRLGPGDLAVVPADHWHRQVPDPEVRLLFGTEMATTEHKPFVG
jgi:quercetin dioxygenase-like cupin family protein